VSYKGVEHIFFDLDHTLWDFDLNSKLAYNKIFTEQKLDLDLDRFIKIYEPLNLEFWRKYRNNEISKEELRYQRLKTAFDACEYHLDDDKINLFANLYITYLPNNNHLFEGCHDLLKDLKSRYKLHCITNGFQEVQKLKMDQSNLTQYFDIILTAEEAKVKKPDPKIFHMALERAGATTQNSLMVGDSHEADIIGAQNLGIRTIYFKIDKPAQFETGQVQKLSEIQSLLSL